VRVRFRGYSKHGVTVDLTETQELLRGTVRDFARQVVRPRAARIDRTGEFGMDTFREMARLGLTGIPIPEAYGGAGADYTSFVVAVEELARECPSTALGLCAHTSLGTLPILHFGSEELKRRYVPPHARGETIGAYGLTEAEAGSDSANTKTTAVEEGGRFRIQGTKMFVTNASVADTFVVTAVTEPDRPKHERISAWVLERGWPGLSIAKKEDKLGMRGSDTCVVHLDRVSVPASNLIGARGDGFKIFMKTLDSGRIAIGALALGIAEGAMERAVRYARERRQFGKPLAEHQAIQMMIADMAVDIEASRRLVYAAAHLRDRDRPHAREASIAKLFAGAAAMRVTRAAVQILGGYGFMTEYEVERFYRDAKLCEIGEGTSEIQRLVIARHVLAQTRTE
jgi:butyryl-CoA dehydrogenase